MVRHRRRDYFLPFLLFFAFFAIVSILLSDKLAAHESI
jgi:hypothetical protein